MRKLTFYRHVTNAHIGCVVKLQMSRFKHFVVPLTGLCGTYSETSKIVFLVTRLLPYLPSSNKIKPLHQPALFRCNLGYAKVKVWPKVRRGMINIIYSEDKV